MNTRKIKQLIDKYFAGESSLEEEQQLREYFRRENIPDELKSYAGQFRYFEEQSNQPANIDPLAKIDFEKEPDARLEKIVEKPVSGAFTWPVRIAAGFILLLIGFSAGHFWSDETSASDQEMTTLQSEVRQIKEALMYDGIYQQASAGERLSAVHTSTRLFANEKLDRQITEILIRAMNNDESVNVRIAAAEGLFQFREEPRIRKALVHSLNEQDDPLMQITLINMLVQLKAKGAINEMNKLLMKSDTRQIVRKRLEAGIAALKA
ncbi:MAG TPA: HEAT repeat domain-containing protein [Balneolaceae bacterium]|nr:HEAT repeat domain-containing protein [Balneolaceae bacterium]